MKQYDEGQISDQGHPVQESHCPVCNGQDLDYGTLQLDGNQAYYPWECMDCGSKGQEWYNMQFSGQNIKEEK